MEQACSWWSWYIVAAAEGFYKDWRHDATWRLTQLYRLWIEISFLRVYFSLKYGIVLRDIYTDSLQKSPNLITIHEVGIKTWWIYKPIKWNRKKCLISREQGECREVVCVIKKLLRREGACGQLASLLLNGTLILWDLRESSCLYGIDSSRDKTADVHL